MRLSRATQLTAALLLVGALALASRASAQLILVGNDEKVGWDDAGKVVLRAPGKDTISIVDIANREAPRIVASLPTDELGLRPSDQPPDHPRRNARARRQLDGRGPGR